MEKIWILILIAFAACGVTAQSEEFPDYWQSDYDSQWYDAQIEKLGILTDDDKPNQEFESNEHEDSFDASDANADEKVQEDIQQFLEEPKEINDYQIEDNRSKLAAEYDYDDEQINEPKADDEHDSFDEESPVANERIENLDKLDETIEELDLRDLPGMYDLQEALNEASKGNEEQETNVNVSASDESPLVYEPIKNFGELDEANEEPDANNFKEEIKEQNFEDSQEVIEDNLEEVVEEPSNVDANDEQETGLEPEPADDSNDYDVKPDSVNEEDMPQQSDNEDISKIAQETEQLLEKETDDFDDNNEQVNDNKEEIDVIPEPVANEVNFEADQEKESGISKEDDGITSNEDLAQELNNLFDKIIQEDPNLAAIFDDFEEKETNNDEQHFDHKYANQANDVEDQLLNKMDQFVDDGDQPIYVAEQNIDEVDQIISEIEKQIIGQDEQDNENADNIDEEEDLDEEQSLDYETVDEVYNSMKDDFNKLFETLDKLTASSESNETEESPDNVEVNISEYEAVENRPFNEENILKLRKEQYDDDSEEKPNVNSVINEDKNLFEAEVTSAELNDLMVQFALDHGDDLDVQSENFDKNIAAVNIKISTDQATIVTSPNYPDPYTTNNIIDWIFEGEGMGIELNVTDFSVNGFLGDYLLVKPGGLDDSGRDGLIFSYNLNSVRRYRFLDVNRMFVRFEAKPGMAFARGFSFSVRMITPPVEETEDVPDTEALIDLPQETLLVYVAGLVPSQFANISEEFRLIVADMATLYLNRAGDDIGEKITSEVTQITTTAACNINWPGFERCTAVRFGIPLSLPESDDYRMTQDDLNDMWSNMLTEDPFLARMRRLGITEFAVPNEESTLLVWVVISVGVVISAAMLGLALWRWSCFEDYTRMAPYSDTDSVLEKKQPLELYPAPHQHLPALYDDDFVKYDYDTTRVDMGGYTNQSYSRDAELFDIDSDDDVRALPNTKRERFTTDV